MNTSDFIDPFNVTENHSMKDETTYTLKEVADIISIISQYVRGELYDAQFEHLLYQHCDCKLVYHIFEVIPHAIEDFKKALNFKDNIYSVSTPFTRGNDNSKVYVNILKWLGWRWSYEEERTAEVIIADSMSPIIKYDNHLYRVEPIYDMWDSDSDYERAQRVIELFDSTNDFRSNQPCFLSELK